MRYLILCLLSLASLPWAATSWVMRNPWPSNANLVKAIHADGKTLALGEYGTGVLAIGGRDLREIIIPGLHGLRDALWTGSRFVVAGNPGEVAVSSDGITWTNVSIGADAQINSMVWTGSGIFALDDQGLVFTSPDGLTWTSPSWGPSYGYILAEESRLAWTGAGYFATALEIDTTSVSNKPVIIQSIDGKNWTTAKRLDTAVNFPVVEMQWIDSQLVVLGNWGAIMTSRDGKKWFDRRAADYKVGWYLATGPSSLLAISQTGTGVYSKDRVVWKDTSLPELKGVHDLVWADSEWVGVGGDAMFMVAKPGGPWKDLSSPLTQGLNSVAWNGSSYLAVDNYGNAVSSSDGVAWSAPRSIANFEMLNQVIWAGTQWVVVGRGGVIYTSPDGKDWTKRWSGSFGPHSVVWTGTRLVAAGWSDSVFTSPDGAVWTRSLGATHGFRYYHLAASGNLIVAVGEYGVIMTSPDGVEWTKRDSPTKQSLTSVVWTGSFFTAAGTQIVTSPDGIVWTLQPQDFPVNILGMTWTGANLLAVGRSRFTYSSKDGSHWSREDLIAPPDYTGLNDVIATRDTYVAVGEGGMILTAQAAPVNVAPAPGSLPPAKKLPGAHDALGRSRLNRRALLRFP